MITTGRATTRRKEESNQVEHKGLPLKGQERIGTWKRNKSRRRERGGKTKSKIQ